MIPPPSSKPSRAPLLATVAGIVVLAAAYAYTYETSSATIASQSSSINSLGNQNAIQAGSISALNGEMTSYQGQVASLNANVTSQVSARHALQQELAAATTTMVSLSSEVSSQSSEIAAQNSEISAAQSTIGVQVQQTILNGQTINMPFNSSTTVTSFTVSYGGYVQISGTSSTSIGLAICYGATTQSACDSSRTYYLVYFGTSGTYSAPLMPGPVWINAYNYNAGTATLTVVEWT